MNEVWVFNGPSGTFPSAVFGSKEKAEEKIRDYKLTGTLTKYELNLLVAEWAWREELITTNLTPAEISNLTRGEQERYHYKEGDNA